ncbi:BTAD domain-containing putative transcriptional regulator [Streptomyces sp. NPDC005805]|uniref:BTAD domain-containing putative transcriptional regulator n=1 Tax=Streptomyces sp. NPDC005805 TaxID=3157068 RepID=UPI0033CA582F
MEFTLLGPFEARRAGRPVPVANRRQERCLLGVLLLEADRALSTGRLIGLLWPGTPPPSARGTLHTYIGRLRAALARHDGPRVETAADGYRLRADGHHVDAHTFTGLVRRADRAPGAAVRAALYEEALGLWRGPLLADTAGDELREQLGAGLDELWLTAVEQRAAAHLELGLTDRVAADLAPLAARHPGRERLVGTLMTALHRAGRRADALELYARARQELAEELGVEPGTRLRALHERVRGGDPGPDGPPVPVHAVRVGGEWLPWTTSGRPALEFCNTRAGWNGPPSPASEWLRHYRTLAVWSGHHGLADEWEVSGLLRRAADEPERAAAALAEARAFRARLYACLTGPDDVRAFGDVARLVDEASAASVFVRGDDGLGRRRIAPAAGLRLPLLAVALDAAGLLSGPERFLVRACPGEGCGWLFADEGGRRRWCSMRTCGGTGSATH